MMRTASLGRLTEKFTTLAVPLGFLVKFWDLTVSTTP